MDDQHHRPKTQTAADGDPPKPPKKIAKALGDDSEDDSIRKEIKKLSEAELMELRRWLEKHDGKPI